MSSISMTLDLTPTIKDSLATMRATLKFVQETCYPGAPSEEVRAVCGDRGNVFLLRIESLLAAGSTEEEALHEAKRLEEAFVPPAKGATSRAWR